MVRAVFGQNWGETLRFSGKTTQLGGHAVPEGNFRVDPPVAPGLPRNPEASNPEPNVLGREKHSRSDRCWGMIPSA